VDASERSAVVTRGLFAQVRNPIFTAMAVTGVGLVLMVPNVFALASFLVLIVAVDLEVRR
jgi:protein-S-isoprenylcysteine O-methyltransferase Ste14